MEFPHLQKLYEQHRDDGLEILAINVSDTEKLIRHYLSKEKVSFRIALAKDTDVHTLFGLRGYPTNYLIDGEGTVVWRSTGFDEASLRSALAKLGVK